MTAMIDTPDSTGENVAVVERFLAAFDRRWPAEDELAELLGPNIRITERPNLINPRGSERDRAAMRAGLRGGTPAAGLAVVRGSRPRRQRRLRRNANALERGARHRCRTLACWDAYERLVRGPLPPRGGPHHPHRTARLLRAAIAAGGAKRGRSLSVPGTAPVAARSRCERWIRSNSSCAGPGSHRLRIEAGPIVLRARACTS